MRDVASIKKAVQFDKQLYKITQFDTCVNNGLTFLWNDENVVYTFICSIDDDYSYVLLITDKCRLITCSERKVKVNGSLFDRTNISRSSGVDNLMGVDPNKTRCIERKLGGLFGKTLYDIVFEGHAQSSRMITCDDKDKAFAIKDAVLTIASKSPSSTQKSGNAHPVTTSTSAITEIRKMYEDGIIDKEEMLDLIKALKK